MPDQSSFVADIKSAGESAHIDYVLSERGGIKCMDLVHTFVPPSGRGLGLAGKLCDAAFEYATANSYRVIPSCTYISGRYLEKNPERKKACL